MKTIKLFSLLTCITLVAILASCSKKESNTNVTPVIPPSHPISAGNISGFVKGTLLTGSTLHRNRPILLLKKGTPYWPSPAQLSL